MPKLSPHRPPATTLFPRRAVPPPEPQSPRLTTATHPEASCSFRSRGSMRRCCLTRAAATLAHGPARIAAAVVEEERSQSLGDRAHELAMGHAGEQLLIEPQAPLGEPAGVAGGAEVATLAVERDQKLGAALGAADARDPVLEQAAVEEAADRPARCRAQRAVRGLEALLVLALE